MAAEAAALEAENARLKKELASVSARSGGGDQVRQKDQELESMRSGMARLARQLDEEITKKDGPPPCHTTCNQREVHTSGVISCLVVCASTFVNLLSLSGPQHEQKY